MTNQPQILFFDKAYDNPVGRRDHNVRQIRQASEGLEFDLVTPYGCKNNAHDRGLDHFIEVVGNNPETFRGYVIVQPGSGAHHYETLAKLARESAPDTKIFVLSPDGETNLDTGHITICPNSRIMEQHIPTMRDMLERIIGREQYK